MTHLKSSKFWLSENYVNLFNKIRTKKDKCNYLLFKWSIKIYYIVTAVKFGQSDTL